ncbi:MAG: hypothetical protein P4L81_02760 [Candidatus Pacebacteria bacterium]|nr:hypothetical protein [Candidatus Paceibacterota bacterium]
MLAVLLERMLVVGSCRLHIAIGDGNLYIVSTKKIGFLYCDGALTKRFGPSGLKGT